MASKESLASSARAGRSATHNGHPGGGSGHEGSGCQPGGATHPAGAGGQPGGGLNRILPAVTWPASPIGHAASSDRLWSWPIPASPAVRNALPHCFIRSKSLSRDVVAICPPWSVVPTTLHLRGQEADRFAGLER